MVTRLQRALPMFETSPLIFASCRDCPSYLASAETVRDLLLPAETTVHEKWLPAETNYSCNSLLSGYTYSSNQISSPSVIVRVPPHTHTHKQFTHKQSIPGAILGGPESPTFPLPPIPPQTQSHTGQILCFPPTHTHTHTTLHKHPSYLSYPQHKHTKSNTEILGIYFGCLVWCQCYHHLISCKLYCN